MKQPRRLLPGCSTRGTRRHNHASASSAFPEPLQSHVEEGCLGSLFNGTGSPLGSQHGKATRRPPELRREATRGFLAEQRRACFSWVTERFSGGFSEISGMTELPSVQLLTTNLDVRLDPAQDGYEASPGWFRTIPVHPLGAPGCWPRYDSLDPEPFAEDDLRTLTFGCRRGDAIDPANRAGRPQPESDWSIAQFADGHLQGLVLRWALRNLLVEHRAAFRNSRCTC